MIKKIGENLSQVKIESPDSYLPLLTQEIVDNFQSTASGLKRLAPAADDFLFFSAVMMHSAEASAINEDGSPKLTKEGKPVEVGWRVDANGSWKWITNDPNVKPYKNCFVPGTKVVMADGSSKNIEDIQSGDKVITHLGNVSKVNKSFITPHSGKVLKIKFSNGLEVVTTPNHEFYSAKITSRQIKNKNVNIDFIKAQDLTNEWYVTSPITSKKIESKINYSFAKLLGLFAAEGSFSKKKDKKTGVCFSVHKDENHLIKFISNEIEKTFGKKAKISFQNNKCDVKLYSTEFAKVFYKYCGEYSANKTISEEIVFNSDNEVKRQFILGWLEGDGHFDKQSGKVVGTTVSSNMATQIKLMLDSLKIQSGIFKGKENSIDKNFRIKIPYLNVEKYFQDLSKYSKKNVRKSFKSDFSNDYRFHKILKIEELDYDGDVYNFEVEGENSYCVTNARIAVHNCNADIFPEKELIIAHKKWVNKPLCIDHKSSSVDHVRGFIVDTYYDSKLKRVVALCALDKKNYPDLAHKVAVGITPSVSMGTGVSTAICTDCGRVAKAENDFCDHMRYKSAYGEINVGLNPIELSIVVNPADPRAQIKHIIAAAENLNSYVKTKQTQLKKVAKPVFNASLGFSNKNDDDKSSSSASFNISTDDLPSFLKDLDSTIEKLKDMLDKADKKDSKDSNDADDSDSDSNTIISEPAEKFAGLNTNLESLAARIDSIKQGLDRLLKEETDMSDRKKEAYFQGTEEPTPGEVKYDKDPKNEQLRQKGDRQLDVDDMGPIDGMHPGPKSVGMSEFERKKMLARAEIEERAFKRAAILESFRKEAEGTPILTDKQEKVAKDFPSAKDATIQELSTKAPMLTEKIMACSAPSQVRELFENATVKGVVLKLLPSNPALNRLYGLCCGGVQKAAYFQGGGGLNEPTPGKTKYPVDKTNVDLRDEDKQMVGAKPFPEVGDVSKLYSDDQKVKEKLLRASLNAKFIKASTEDGAINLDRSGWEVYSDGQLVLKASVNELTGGRGELFYDSVATKEFGEKLVSQVKTAGAAKVSKMFKSAQAPAPEAAPAPAAQMPDLPADLPPGPEAAPAPAPEANMDDPKQKALSLADDAANVVSDLKEAITALTDEKAQMGEPAADGGNQPPKTASFSVKALHEMRSELNTELTASLKECVAELNEHISDMKDIADMCSRKVVTASNKNLAESIFESSFDDVKETFAKAHRLIEAFVKYAKGAGVLVKRAQAEEAALAELNSDEEGDLDLEGLSDDSDVGELMDLVKDDTFEGESTPSSVEGELGLESEDHEGHDLDLGDEDLELGDENLADMSVNHNALDKLDKNKVKPGDKVTVTASLDSKEGRMALRAKLAKDTMKLKVEPLLGEAHPKGGTTPKFDVSVSDKLDHVEDLEEVQKAMLDAVHKAPAKVKKEAEMIHKLISEGSLSVDELDELVAQGADKDAVAYYKKYFGQVDGGSEFASELVKEHAAKKAKADLEVEKLKMARAYDLAYEMAEKGLCSSDKKTIASKVDEFMKFNDEGFESLKAIVASATPKLSKQAGKIPAVGYGNDSYTSKEEDLVSQLSAILTSSKRRMF